MAADRRERPHAVRGARADPLDRRQRPPPQLLLELRPARVVPRHRARVPPLAPRARRVGVVAGRAGAAGRVRPRLPGPGHAEQRPDPLLHGREADRGAGVGDAAADLRGGGSRDDVPGGGRRPAVPELPGADRVPPRPDRQPRGHRRLHGPLVPRRAAARVGAGRRRGLPRGPPPAGPAASRRGPAGAGRAARRRVAERRRQLVAVLQDPRPGPSATGPTSPSTASRTRRSATSRSAAGWAACGPCPTSAPPAGRCATS